MSHKIHHGQYVLIRSVIDSYKHDEPLHLFLKSFFRKNKKCGSRDRRIITQQVYNYYRLGKALPDVDFEERLAIADFLISGLSKNKYFEEETFSSNSIDSRLLFIQKKFPEFYLNDIFPFADDLSIEIDKEVFIKSFLKRPDVWIRIRSGFEKHVEDDFTQSKIEFEISPKNKNAWRIKSETKLDSTISFRNGSFEIQDLSSQQTGIYFQPKQNETWWDCCCGSGGKSLLLMDMNPSINLVVSDVRESILESLKHRFQKAGINKYKPFVMDLSILNNAESFANKIGSVDSILADVPCTGSGTWARNPEELFFFKKENINNFQEKQISIVKNASKQLMPNGKLIYITCSVFKKENEDVCELISKNTNLHLLQKDYIKGYMDGADTMFAAVFKNN